MKIGFVSIGNITDRRLWSGTISFLADELSKKYSIIPIYVSNKPRRLTAAIYKYFGVLNRYKIPFWGRFILQFKIFFSKCNVFFIPSGSEIIARCFFPKDKLIIYLSDATYHLMIDYYYHNESDQKQKYYNKVERNALERADIVIESSEWAARDAASYYGTDLEKIHVLPFGSNLPDCYYEKDDIDSSVINLLLIGVDWKRKGIDIAIDTVRILNSFGERRYELTIVGFDRPNIKYEEFIHFAGRLNKNLPQDTKKLIHYYLASDIFILPTQAECSAIVFSEAAMYGLPVFTYSTGGTETYVETGYNGVCLSPGSSSYDFAHAISASVDSGEFRVYAEHARQKYLDELNWSKWFNDFDEIVSSCVNNRN